MMPHPCANPLDGMPDDRLTFSDVTTLALLAVTTVVLSALVLLGAVSAEHRIAAVLCHW